MPALWTYAPGSGPEPAVIFCNGLDTNKEMLYWTRLPEELARRGISALCVDQPGSGEARWLSTSNSNSPPTHIAQLIEDEQLDRGQMLLEHVTGSVS